MDFTLTDEQKAIAELADRILADHLTPERLAAVEARPDWFAAEVWQQLARTDLLGVSLPEAHGGGGHGLLETTLVLEAIGRATAPVPVLATVVLGALPIAEFGSVVQRSDLLPGVASGETLLTAALGEDLRAIPPERPRTTASRDGGRWRLTGRKTLVPSAALAHRILVPAATDDRVTVFLLDPSADGVELVDNRTLTGEPLHTLELDGVAIEEAEILGDLGCGQAIVERMTELRTVAACAVQAGVCDAATRLTAEYSSGRHQFDTPIATFQAVAHRMADAYIDTEAVRLTARRAAWALDHADELGDPRDLTEIIAVAGHWAADAAHRVVHAAQHIHGGIGVDTDYPIHRTFRWAKQLEFGSGHATDHLRALGRALARR